MKRWLFVAVTVTALPLLAAAGRPLAVDDAGTVAPGECEFEAGVTFEHERDCHHVDFPLALTAGIVPTLDAGIGFGGQWEERFDEIGNFDRASGLGDLTLGAKWSPLAADRFWADHAVALTLKLPTADSGNGLGSGKVDGDVTYIATKDLSDRFSVDLNLGHTWVGGTENELHYGVALRWQALEKVELVGEILAGSVLAAGHDTTAALHAGLRWQVLDNLTLDAAVGVGLTDDAKHWSATIGFTWAFGFNRN